MHRSGLPNPNIDGTTGLTTGQSKVRWLIKRLNRVNRISKKRSFVYFFVGLSIGYLITLVILVLQLVG